MITRKFYELKSVLEEAGNYLEFLISEGFEYEDFQTKLDHMIEVLDSDLPGVDSQYV